MSRHYQTTGLQSERRPAEQTDAESTAVEKSRNYTSLPANCTSSPPLGDEPGSLENSHITGNVVLIRNQSGEIGRRNTDEEKMNPDPLSERQTLVGVVYASSVSLDDIFPEPIRLIATIPCFACQTVLLDAENDFSSLQRYVRDGKYVLGATSDALSSRIWRDATAIDEVYPRSSGTSTDKPVCDVKDV